MRVSDDERYLVALDLDGTVVRRGGAIDEHVGNAIRAVSDAGHEVVIATGRSIDSTISVAEELKLRPEWIVCCNGAITLKRDPLGYRAYRREYVEAFNPREVLERIGSHMITTMYGVETVAGEFYSTEEVPAATLPPRRHVVSFDELKNLEATRVLVKSPSHVLTSFLDSVDTAGLSRTTYGIGDTVWLDIAPSGVSKESALETVRARLNIHRSRVFAAGDGNNDIAMLKWADRHGDAVAMGQAADDVKAAAGRVTDSIDEGGLYRALRFRFPVELGYEGYEAGDLD